VYTRLFANVPLADVPIVLFVKLSVVAFPTRVSVAFGAVIVPEELKSKVPAPLTRFVAVLPEIVLLVSVWVLLVPTRVVLASGSAIARPEVNAPEMVVDVAVLEPLMSKCKVVVASVLF
jgi:hypothetical protein